MYPILAHRSTWIHVDLEQLKKNLTYVQKTAKDKEIWAVVKSDAYAHGIEGLFSTFVHVGITKFCVGQYDEALHLQAIANQHQIEIDMLIFGSIPIDKIATILPNWRISLTNFEEITEITNFYQNSNMPHIKVHLKIDSGMNRRGFKTAKDFDNACEILDSHPNFEIEGLYTHFSTSDCDEQFMHHQVENFKKISRKMLKKVKYIHAQNSYGILNLGDDLFNLVRPGGICYGMTGVEHPVCKPIFKLYSKIIETKVVKRNEVVGYGNTYTVNKDGYLAVIPIGYADGWRKINTGLDVFVSGKRAQIVGKICMEQCMIFAEEDIFNKNDVVELVGKNQNIFKVADHNGIFDYEFVCSFLPRVPRIYFSDEEVY